VPFDAVAAREMLHDYTGTYTALRQYGVDAGKAQELATKRLSAEWAPSAVAGNQLMRYPPERYYPPINGSQDWMRRDLEDLVTSVRGPQMTTQFEGTPDATMSANWRVRGLVADAQTQADIAAGKPPSYLIALDGPDGLTELLTDRAGNKRFTWDRRPAVQAYEQQWRQTDDYRRTANDLRANALTMGAGP
jgi:hypothetical protein